MYLIKVPAIIRVFNKDLIWEIPGKEKRIFLTFDDGPAEEVTPKILEILNKYNAKATFFCTGSKADKFPKIIQEIKNQGHTIGNHSYSHLKGTKTSTVLYLADVEECAEILPSRLFRPPFGRITPQQKRELKKNFRIIMWSVLPGDFDERVTKEVCLHRSIKYTRKGSIIVFHDNMKSKENVIFTLPRYIEYFMDTGFVFEAITSELID